MRVFRLARTKYKLTLSGEGAARYGNRWNSKGVEMIYTADSRALAMAEVAVHLTLATIPSGYLMLEIDVPDEISIETLNISKLNDYWRSFPHQSNTQKMGDTFIQAKKACILKVPSAVVQGDFNYLINPNHENFSAIKIIECVTFPIDKRLFI